MLQLGWESTLEQSFSAILWGLFHKIVKKQNFPSVILPQKFVVYNSVVPVQYVVLSNRAVKNTLGIIHNSSEVN